ncbi:hypothetical protein DSO57_1030951 [Entomophthora muscae]|uniref:Uncharacterized protein n=1 Tax=Entomophthora muscae TaxID=34485 RepID=A0ACC2U9T3_9FUNG|nr:hypothetical protein DSO57_1030951 [Entomophthora muscae]
MKGILFLFWFLVLLLTVVLGLENPTPTTEWHNSSPNDAHQKESLANVWFKYPSGHRGRKFHYDCTTTSPPPVEPLMVRPNTSFYLLTYLVGYDLLGWFSSMMGRFAYLGHLGHLAMVTVVRIRPDTSCVTEMPWENSTILHNPNDSLMTLLAALDNELWLFKVWLPAKLPNQCKVTKICNQGTRIDANLNLSITQQPLDRFGRPSTHFEAKHQESQIHAIFRQNTDAKPNVQDFTKKHESCCSEDAPKPQPDAISRVLKTV